MPYINLIQNNKNFSFNKYDLIKYTTIYYDAVIQRNKKSKSPSCLLFTDGYTYYQLYLQSSTATKTPTFIFIKKKKVYTKHTYKQTKQKHTTTNVQSCIITSKCCCFAGLQEKPNSANNSKMIIFKKSLRKRADMWSVFWMGENNVSKKSHDDQYCEIIRGQL